MTITITGSTYSGKYCTGSYGAVPQCVQRAARGLTICAFGLFEDQLILNPSRRNFACRAIRAPEACRAMPTNTRMKMIQKPMFRLW